MSDRDGLADIPPVRAKKSTAERWAMKMVTKRKRSKIKKLKMTEGKKKHLRAKVPSGDEMP